MRALITLPDALSMMSFPRARRLAAGMVAMLALCGSGRADEAAQRRWIEGEFQPSTLSPAAQAAEMRWFAEAAAPYRGMTIRIASPFLTTHAYESKVLAEAFGQITGISVTQELLPADTLLAAFEKQRKGASGPYDGWIVTSDLIGTLQRSGGAVDLTDWMVGEGKDVTNPGLALDDYIGTAFTTGADGHLYQLPDQQSATLYWFRYDWFTNPDYKARFKARYGYDLGVPVNWSAYEDIAAFFTDSVGTIDGNTVYGHMDHGQRDALSDWRFADAWLAMAGGGDRGLPNGRPVDEWGIRMEGCSPAGSSVERGGATNGPAAVSALATSLDWLKRYAPPQAAGMGSAEAAAVPAQGTIAQQAAWPTSLIAEMTRPGLPVMNADGTPKWRVAPTPHGAYWREGMKRGYQEVGAATLLTSAPLDRRKAAWLYLQFISSRTVSLKKSHVGLTFVRESDIQDGSFTERAPQLGGLIEFYRSPARRQWTPGGGNVPDYPAFARLRQQALEAATSGARTPQAALDDLAAGQDGLMQRLQASGAQGACEPRLNPATSAEDWQAKAAAAGTLAPQRRLADDRPKGETVDYDTLVRSWSAAP